MCNLPAKIIHEGEPISDEASMQSASASMSSQFELEPNEELKEGEIPGILNHSD